MAVFILALPLIVAGLTQLYFVQNFIKDTAVNYLEKKLGTPVTIGAFHMNGFSGLVLEDVRLEDRQHRTLLYSGSLRLHYDLLPLLRKRLVVYNLQWQDVRADVYRPARDSAFNYQFILDAFATSPDTAETASGASYHFQIDTVQLRRFQLRYHDSLGGTLASVAFDTIGLLPGELNPDSMRFALHDLYVDSLRADIRLPASEDAGPDTRTDTATAGGALPSLAAERITLLDTRILFDQGPEGFGTGDTIGALRIRGLTLDMSGNRILADSLVVADASTAIRLGPSSDEAAPPEPPADTASAGYYIRGGWLSLKHTRFRMEVTGAPASPYRDAVDFNHLDVDSLNATFCDVVFDTDTLHGLISHVALRERSGFHLRELRGRVWYDPGRLSLDDLLLVTAHSRLTDTLEVSVPSWSTVSDDLNALALRLNLDSSVLDGRDARYFAPWLADNASLKPLLVKRLSIDLRAAGRLSALDIARFSLSDGDGNFVRLKGRVLNAGLPDSLWADLVLEDIRTGDAPLRSWLAPGQLPASVALPDRIALSGMLAAGLQAARADLRIATSDGNAKLTATLADYLDSLRARYQVSFALSELAAGKLAGDSLLGRITASGMVDGRGWAFPRMEDTARVTVASLDYNGYTYHDITLGGSYTPSAFSVQADSRDTAVRFVLKASGSLDSTNGYLDGMLSAQRLDLYATHWTSSPLNASFDLKAQLASLRPYHLQGAARLDSLELTTDSSTVRLDSIRLVARDSTERQFITLEAPFGQLQATGHYDYTAIFSDISRMVGRHLAADTLNATAPPGDTMASQDMDLTAAFRWPRSLQSLLPGLSLESPARISLHANTDSMLVSARWGLSRLHYGDFEVDSLAGSLLCGPDSLTAYTAVGSVQHPRFPLGRTRVDVAAAAGTLHTGLAIAGGDGRPKYRLGARVAPEPGGALVIRLDPGVLLNGQSWSVPDDNVIRLASGQLESGRLTLSRGTGQLRLATKPDSGAATAAELSFHNFRLSALTSILANDTALASGMLNGTVTAGDWQHDLRLTADLRIDSLEVMRAALGTLTLRVADTTPKDYAVQLGLKGSGNDVLLAGHYRLGAAEPLDFRLQLQPLSLSSLEPLARDYVTRLKGRLRGALTVTGSTAKPSVLGELTFQNAGFNPSVINSDLHLYHEKISFLPDGVHFDNFVLSDSANNEAVINGIIRTRDYAHYFVDLNLQATDFEVLGPQQSGDQMLYGPAYIDSRITLRGTPGFPRVNMNLKLEAKSNVTFTVPESQPGIEEREGVIRFVDRDHPVDTARSQAAAPRHVAPQGFQFSGNLELTPDAAIRIIIDRQNGDNLYVKGAATLNTTMDAGGNLLLTGQYQIQQGVYALSLNQLIKRSFAIQKGSTITWEGEPTRAQVDITALYLAHAPAVDLVADQLSNLSPQMRNRYKQKEPIEVYLMIKGDMMKPDISFRLDMPEDHQNDLEGVVYNRLKQINLIPSELNKQVMGLLVLNSFIPENPMDIVGNGSGGLEQTARQSVSKILSQQLNNLAAGLIKGVDLNFDLQSQQDYSTGNAENSTQLNVGVSKHLFNDRLTVSVGNDFELEGNSRQASGIAGNVSIAYALTKDGRYRLTAYRKDNNEEIIQGQVVETGVTFSLVMDYDKFSEIFAKAKKEQRLELRRQRKQNRKTRNK